MRETRANEFVPNSRIPHTNLFLRKILKLVTKIPGFKLLIRLVGKPFLNSQGFTYNADGLITNKNCDFMKDPKFIEAYSKGVRQADIPISGYWIFYVTQWAAFHAKQLEGDFVECGVYRGMHAMSTITHIDFKSLKDRKYYLFDTFCGLDKEFSSEEEYLSYEDDYPDCYEFVVDSFKEYPNVVIIKGSVPKTLSQADIRKVSYLHIDMNCVLPELEAIKYFWPKLETGAIVILDDYGWPGHENQKKAMDDFCSSVGVKVLSLPTGQGMIIKPTTSVNCPSEDGRM